MPATHSQKDWGRGWGQEGAERGERGDLLTCCVKHQTNSSFWTQMDKINVRKHTLRADESERPPLGGSGCCRCRRPIRKRLHVWPRTCSDIFSRSITKRIYIEAVFTAEKAAPRRFKLFKQCFFFMYLSFYLHKYWWILSAAEWSQGTEDCKM